MSFEVKKINSKMPEYKEIIDIYRSSFPRTEQISIWILRLMSHKKNFYWLAFYDDNRLCGFVYFMVNSEALFILFLAVDNRIRSKGYGSRILSWLRERYPSREIFLDVETIDESAANSKQRRQRIEFYRKNGIYQTGSFVENKYMVFEILSTDKTFDEERYEDIMKSYFRIF